MQIFAKGVTKVYETKKERREHYKFMRISKEIKLEEVSKIVGYSISTISRYENCKRDMDSESVKMYQEYIENYIENK